MDESVLAELQRFQKARGFAGKGPLCVALHITRLAKEVGLPLRADTLLTPSGGQVAGLGKGRIQAILADHHERRVLASEGGRTSRGSVGNAHLYAAFLNELDSIRNIELGLIEDWWVQRVREFFESKPLRINLESGRTVESIISDILKQAKARQKDQRGSTFAGTVLQHLIGAKLEIVLGNNAPTLAHHGASVADASTARTSDFVINRASIHVTLTPGDDVIAKCTANIESGFYPILIVPFLRAQAAMQRTEELGLGAKVEIIPAEQFLASNVHEWAGFNSSRTEASLGELVAMYNQIVGMAETDQSLLIDI